MTQEQGNLLIFGIIAVVILILSYDTHRKVLALSADLDEVLAAVCESSRIR